MSDGMITMRARMRILDTDRRLDIYPGPVKAPAAFFEKYGPRFEPYKPGKNDPEVQVISSWADKSRAAEYAEIRKAARLAAKREAEAVSKAAAAEAAAEIEAEAESEAEPEVEAEVEPAAVTKAAVDDGKLLPPEKAVWTGAKKLKKKV